MVLKRVLPTLVVGALYAVAAAIVLSPVVSPMFGVGGGAVAYLLTRPDVLDESLTRYSPRLERIGLAISLVGGLVGFLAGAAGTLL
ncbi:hypothetical protein ACOZ4I_11205 [Haloarcula salina]|uniref:hypothetical protein n=1 Tax=Haloarcula salina TaxID=1429914 RepID=UPI003C6FFF24